MVREDFERCRSGSSGARAFGANGRGMGTVDRGASSKGLRTDEAPSNGSLYAPFEMNPAGDPPTTAKPAIEV
jgi:hypothetical protein